MENLPETIQQLAIDYGLQVLGSIGIFLVGWWLAKQIVKYARRLMRRADVDGTLVSFSGNVLYWLLLSLVIVAALTNLGISTTSVVAVLGAATLAVGLALQDSLGNLAAGVVIILLRPYQSGDYVVINDADGYVTGIQLFHTTLRTRDNKFIFVPNSDVMSGNIINYSREGLIRLDLVYGIGYGDDLQKAKAILEEIVGSLDQVASEPAPVVAVKELGDNSVNLVAR
ncbi:MAG: mechanosensitive ion channel, partial [Candidatus Promineifilaceae bacterium]|nr:mechanosensitive ion channel [Candidatus Promineifilaceae bacterium]